VVVRRGAVSTKCPDQIAKEVFIVVVILFASPGDVPGSRLTGASSGAGALAPIATL
jgi:hypothetical protein